ncbi:unnamed protein product [Ranitomeya imitator]|uniref:Uncharacterized protein n=1 Tax=Ranitomeya imitator TaxID=111125 RepID=A0ABN9LJE0_9NEOB|nr:unnamed protein product [Ranitomeya imitator]
MSFRSAAACLLRILALRGCGAADPLFTCTSCRSAAACLSSAHTRPARLRRCGPTVHVYLLPVRHCLLVFCAYSPCAAAALRTHCSCVPPSGPLLAAHTGQAIRARRIVDPVQKKEYLFETGHIPIEWEGNEVFVLIC